MHPFSLEGKTAFVAGASRGIGLAIARHIAEAGARTILAARSTADLEKHAAELKNAGHDTGTCTLDVTKQESIDAAVNQVGAVDIFIAVAGTNLRKHFIDYTQAEYDQMMVTNLHGLFGLTQGVARKMIERGTGGKIIIIGSLTSLIGLPYLTVYAMTKSALAGLTRTLAAELGKHNIQVNCIAPGFILTDLNRHIWKREDLLAWLRGVQANPRVGTPEDVAPMAVFLAGRGADYITGQVIAIDGGYTTAAVWPFAP